MRPLVSALTVIWIFAAGSGCSRLILADDDPPHAPPPDAPFVIVDAPSGCERCTADQMCIEEFTVDCVAEPFCVPRTVPNCAPSETSCSPACEEAYCTEPFQCEYRNGCPSAPGAFTCYGP